MKSGARRGARDDGQAEAAPLEFPVDPVPGYAFASRIGRERGDLVLVFSSDTGFAMLRHDFGRDVVHLADRGDGYFLGGAPELARSLVALIARGGYRRTLFVGSSKAGFAALSLASICARLAPSRAFHAVAMGAQTRLYPFNPNLGFASYQRLLKKARRDASLADLLRRYGDVAPAGDLPNLRSVLIYARDHPVDRAEAARMRGPNATLREVAGSIHGVLFHFLSRKLSREVLIGKLERAYRRDADADLDWARPGDIGAAADEVIASAAREPDLNELFDEVLADAPGRPALAARIARRLRWRAGRLFALGRYGGLRPTAASPKIHRSGAAPDS